MTKTILGLEENVEGALCYLIGFITGIVFYILDPNNKFVKFHAVQSIVTFLPLFVLGILVNVMPFFMSWAIGSILWLLEIILWLILILKAYQGEKFKLPVVGDISEQIASK